MSLRERCQQFLAKAKQDAILRQGSPVDALIEFVSSEVGRKADKRLDDSLPLVLYFANENDRQMVIDAIHAEHPNWVARKVP